MAHSTLPDDFREINICPESRELLGHGELFLRKNIVSGKYDGVESYLDIQFRLLRENFIRPWRENILEYQYNCSVNASNIVNDKKLNVYRNVRILGGQSWSVRACQFDCTPFEKSDWENDEKLAIGSLVCLSSNDFATIDYFATVAGPRNVAKSSGRNAKTGKGTINLAFEFNNRIKFANKTFVMIEAPEFFEAYRYHLKALQDFDIGNFPMTKHIINVDKGVSAPSYLYRTKVYRLSNGLAASDPQLRTFDVRVLNKNHWPPGVHHHLGLDESQYEAFRAALTKQLAIIQAPPGTGKIYIGLRIVEALLANGCPLPILIICSSNYTLDRFLEGVLKFQSRHDVLRVTGSSKSKILGECELSSIQSKLKTQDGRGDIDMGRSVKIIGMTTTSAAKNRHIIYGSQPKITLVEEAALVFESEIVLALAADTEHLILIGDHKQLRPRNAHYRLSNDFHHNISLFERLIKNDVQYYQLKEQRRMRPCISSLLRPHIYKQLFDHPYVERYEDVKGMCKNMFFVNHERLEEVDEQGNSLHINLHEASFIVALCKYLIQQGYETKQVTILTMYKAQLIEINELLRADSMLKKIHAASVDSFQGEANDIVLVSFVRSNRANDIGLLKTLNRINVALSRANKGLYCIGNFEGMAKSPGNRGHFPWKEFVHSLKQQKAFGNAFEIVCQIHGTKCLMKSGDDFSKKVPRGGCLGLRIQPLLTDQCLMRNVDANHTTPQPNLFETCNRICPRGHRCEKRSHHPEPCLCTTRIVMQRPGCGHNVSIACWQDPSSEYCTVQVQTRLLCGHSVTTKCSDAKNVTKLANECTEPCNAVKCLAGHRCTDPCHFSKPCKKCTLKVVQVLPKCQHTVRMSCSDNPSTVYCNKPCEKIRRCGHKCEDLCGANCESKMCNQEIQVKSPCGHTVTIKCSDPKDDSKLLNDCTEPCNALKCSTGHCCSDPCHFPKPCKKCILKVVKVLPKCQHTVRMSCSDNPSTVYCNKSCEKIRRCGHKCKDKCGANCEDKICTEQTQVKSQCGHTVTIKCSDSKDFLKLVDTCTEPCNVKLQCSAGHRCSDPCHYPKPCKKCILKVDTLLPRCQHIIRISCNLDPSTAYCTKPCNRTRRCGHKCKDLCGAVCDEKECPEEVHKTAACGHVVSIACSYANDVSKLMDACVQPCNAHLECGHLCKGSCPRCKYGRFHISCEEKCTKRLACGHPCPMNCSDFCEDLCTSLQNPPLQKKMIVNSLEEKLADKNLPHSLKTVYVSLKNQLDQNSLRSAHELIKTKISLMEPIRQVSLSVYNNKNDFENWLTGILLRFDERMQTVAHFIVNYKDCVQQRNDVKAEVAILKLMADAIVKAAALSLDEYGKRLLNDAFEIVHPSRRVTETMRNVFGRQLLEAYKHNTKDASKCAVM